MTIPTRRWMWSLTLAVLLIGLAAMIYVYGPPPAIASLLNRAASEPQAEDYNVYSAFVDDLFSSSQALGVHPDGSQNRVVYVVGETLERKTPSLLPLDVAVLGPNEMGEDFFRQNARAWRLEPRFHSRFRVLLAENRGPTSSVLRLSRIGFNRKGTLALLFFSYRCGALCAQSGWVVLYKSEGRWHIKQFGSGAIS